MKTIKCLIVSLFLLSMFTPGCKKDDDSDPCDNVTCQNGGNCLNGQCNCPEGYTGEFCEYQTTPSSVTITKIEVTEFPLTNNGSSWDEFNGAPDIFLQLYLGSGISATLLYTSVEIENVNNPIVLTYTPGLPIVLAPVTSMHSIELLDADVITPDFMGGYFFVPFTPGNGFPEVAELSDGGNGITIKLYLTWNF